MTPATAGLSSIDRTAMLAMLALCFGAMPASIRQQFLEQAPATPGVDHLLVLLERGRGQLMLPGFGLVPDTAPTAGRRRGCHRSESVMPFSRQNGTILTSGRWSISEYCTWLLTTLDAGVADDAQVLGVEVRQGQVPDAALGLQVGQLLQGVQVARVSIIPPVELQQVERLACPYAGDERSMACSTTARDILPGRGTHFVKTCIVPLHRPLAGRRVDGETRHEILGRPIVISQVEGREAGVEQVEQAANRRAGSMGPWAPDTCHMPTGSRQMGMSGVRGNRLELGSFIMAPVSGSGTTLRDQE